MTYLNLSTEYLQLLNMARYDNSTKENKERKEEKVRGREREGQ